MVGSLLEAIANCLVDFFVLVLIIMVVHPYKNCVASSLSKIYAIICHFKYRTGFKIK